MLVNTEKHMGAHFAKNDESEAELLTNTTEDEPVIEQDEQAEAQADEAQQAEPTAEPATAEPSVDDAIDAILGEILARVNGEASVTPAETPQAVSDQTAVSVPAETVALPQADADTVRVTPSFDTLPAVLDATQVAPHAGDEGSPNEATPTTDEPSEPASAPEPIAKISASDGPKHASFEEPKKKKRSKLGIVLFLLLIALVGGAYGGGVWASQRYFMPNTTINGEDVSLQPIEEVAARHSESTSGYQVAVTGQGIDLTLTAADVDLRSDGDAYVKDALSSLDPWKWPLQILETHDLTADKSITFDEKKVTKAVTDAVDEFNKTAKQPKDATYRYDDKKHLYEVVPEEAGTALVTEDIVKLTIAAVDELAPSVELGEDLLVQPAVLSDDEQLNKSVADVNAKLSATQKLTVGDNEVFEVGAELIAGWTKVSDKLEVTVDQEAITTWARGPLSDELDTVGKTRSYTRPDGKNVTVTGGEYGWTIDGAELAQQICDNVKAGTAATIDIPMMQTAGSWNPGGQEWGNRYIDIDISEQHVRMYDSSSNLIWESDCVTGNSSEGHDTPEGVWQLNSNKESGSVRLEGPEDKRTGEPEYVSYVTYWMPFVWNAVAMHDATWRYSFGGTIYQTDGSHGCVNLPYDKAEELYGLTEVGDVVITHY